MLLMFTIFKYICNIRPKCIHFCLQKKDNIWVIEIRTIFSLLLIQEARTEGGKLYVCVSYEEGPQLFLVKEMV